MSFGGRQRLRVDNSQSDGEVDRWRVKSSLNRAVEKQAVHSYTCLIYNTDWVPSTSPGVIHHKHPLVVRMTEVDIHDATQRGNITAITTYVRAGGNLYAQDKQGNPPLHVASWYGQEASVAALLGAGVDPAALNSTGLPPIYYAEKNRHDGCAALLRGEAPPDPRRSSSPPHCQRKEATNGDGDTARASSSNKKTEDKMKKMHQDDNTRGGGSTDNGGRTRSPSLLKEDKRVTAETTNDVPAAPPPLLPPPPPTTPSAAGQQVDQARSLTTKLKSKWHLCHDENGDAYHYNESTGESVWAGAEGDIDASAESTTEEHDGRQRPPDGWSFHRDPDSGHGYYLRDATHESLWARPDGSFPGISNGGAAAEGSNLPTASDGGGDGDASADWDTAILFTSEMPSPTAPPPFSSTLELEEARADATDGGNKLDGREDRLKEEEEGQEADKSMLLCTQGVMSTNDFFAARELKIYPTSSGGSPMASAPLAAESGGRRSFCSPSPATVNAPEVEDDSGGVSDQEERTGNDDDDGNKRRGRDNSRAEITASVETYSLDFGSIDVEGVVATGRSTPSDARHLDTSSSSATGHQPYGRKPSSLRGVYPFKTEPEPLPVRVGVWDTAKTKFSSSVMSPAGTGPGESRSSNPPATVGHDVPTGTGDTQPNRHPHQHQQPAGQRKAKMQEMIAMAGTDRDERVDGGGSETPSKYGALVETSAAEEGASGACSSTAVVSSLYPKLVDREGLSGDGCLGDGAGPPDGKGGPTSNGRGHGEGDGAHAGEREVGNATTTPKTGEDVDDYLATVAEGRLSVGSSSGGGGGGDGTNSVDIPGLKDGT